MNSVRCRLLRRGVLMWLGSRLLPATSASIGVKRSAFVSLTKVIETEGSARDAGRTGRHNVVHIDAAGGAQAGGISRTHHHAQDNAPSWITKSGHQGYAGNSSSQHPQKASPDEFVHSSTDTTYWLRSG